MTDSEQIAQYFADAEANNPDAVGRLCEVFYEKLAAIARYRFGSFPRRVADEYAVANEVLQAFDLRVQRGEFVQIRDPSELLLVLSRLTKDRVVDEIRRHSALKRGEGKTRGHSIFVPAGGQPKTGDFDRFQAAQETPSAREMIAEETQLLLNKLPDPQLRTILVLRCEGLTNEEIAEQLEVSVATVERKRRRIRERLADEYPTAEADTL